MEKDRSTRKKGSSSESFYKICIGDKLWEETTGEKRPVRHTRTGLGGIPPVVSLARALPLPQRGYDQLDDTELSVRFSNALKEKGYTECSLYHARAVVRTVVASSTRLLEHPPCGAADLLRHSVLADAVQVVQSSRSAERRLPLLVKFVAYLHTGTITMRTAIADCELVRELCRLPKATRQSRSRHDISLCADRDHPLAQEFILMLSRANEHWTKRAKYNLRLLCEWLVTCDDFRGSTAVNIDFRRVKPEHLFAYYQTLQTQVVSGRIKRGTFRLRVQAIRRFFKFLFVMQHVNQDPAVRLPVVKGREDAPWRIITSEEVRAMMGAALKHSVLPLRDCALFACASGLGLRPSEVAGLRVGDIDWHTAHLRVLGKGSRERTVPIPGPVLLDIERYLRSRPSPLLADDPLWTTSTGVPLSYENFRRLFSDLRKRSGIDRYVGGPHVFRHYFINANVEAGADLEDIAAFVGHTNLRALEPYIHTTGAGVRAALERALDKGGAVGHAT